MFHAISDNTKLTCMDESDPSKTPPLAYLNKEFVNSYDARVIRIIAEYLEPAARMRRHGVRDTIVFFPLRLMEELFAKYRQATRVSTRAS